MAEFRRDPVDGKWVIIAPERKRMLKEFSPEPYPATERRCPFCPGNESLTPPELFAFRQPGTGANQPGWRVRVIPNREPILRTELELEKEGIGSYDRVSGIGAHEVIIETPEHNQTYSLLSENHLKEIYLAWKQRILDLKNDFRLKYVLVFKNYGLSAGAVIPHPHSQLIALPIAPKQILEELRGGEEYFRFKERCIFCDIISQELESKERVVFENSRFLLICPWAPIFPFELWAVPKEHLPVFEESDEETLAGLAEAIKFGMIQLEKTLGDFHFNLVLHNLPFYLSSSPGFHWHIEIMPRLSRVAGFEYGSGFYVNPVPPEESARWLSKGGT